ncbi:MAG: endonuclease domain-containing protein [Chloroflexi bacterium]|nr:endonuclease domain-containing protein [Chloroflexota bacterium]
MRVNAATACIYPPILLRSRELRQPQTPAEATLWRHLRNRNLTYKFRRQHPIDRFIIDFYCAQAKVCIEIDGSQHFKPKQEEYDRARTAFLEELGYKVIRFTNDDVRLNIQAVVDEIVRVIESRLSPHPNPLPSEERNQE